MPSAIQEEGGSLSRTNNGWHPNLGLLFLGVLGRLSPEALTQPVQKMSSGGSGSSTKNSWTDITQQMSSTSRTIY